MDVVTIGESMVLMVPGESGALEYVQNFTKRLAGAESNVAIGLARLGHRVSWLSKVGDDPFGQYVLKTIRGEGVDVSRVQSCVGYPTGMMFKERFEIGDPHVYYYRAGSAASTLRPEDIDEAWLAKARFLLVTGITPALSQSCYEAVCHAMREARKAGITVVFDPNIRFKLWSKSRAREVLLELCGMADMILPGLEEGVFLTGKDQPVDIAKALLRMGARTIVVKVGENGAYYVSDREKALVPGFPIERVIDSIGAGDAFTAGLLSGLLEGLPLSDAVQRANAMGALATTVVGDIEGLPRRDELERFIHRTATKSR